MAAKRPIVVGGNTPGKPESKRPSTEGTSRKTLFQEGNVSKKPPGRREWSDKETGMLVQYICLFWEDAASDKRPMQRDPEFWDGCASAVNPLKLQNLQGRSILGKLSVRRIRKVQRCI